MRHIAGRQCTAEPVKCCTTTLRAGGCRCFFSFSVCVCGASQKAFGRRSTFQIGKFLLSFRVCNSFIYSFILIFLVFLFEVGLQSRPHTQTKNGRLRSQNKWVAKAGEDCLRITRSDNTKVGG